VIIVAGVPFGAPAPPTWCALRTFQRGGILVQMQAITYRNTKTTLPGWTPNLHETWSRGFGYITNGHFIHIFGFDKGLWTICNVVATQIRQGTLETWVQEVFGAQDIVNVDTEVGHTLGGVWRPGIFFDDHALQALNFTSAQLRLAEQSLLLLIQRLDELLLFIEPGPETLSTYSHKARELLILACTECENYWQEYLREARYAPPNGRALTTNDYVKLLQPLYLDEFEIDLPRYPGITQFRPFSGWSTRQPTQSLPWYDHYNKTKHDRTTHFNSATLINCIHAVAAAMVMFVVKFGPYRLTTGTGTLPALINHLFSISLCNPRPESFYVPLVKPPNQTPLQTQNLRDISERWIVGSLSL
jgi:hypothetical protein